MCLLVSLVSFTEGMLMLYCEEAMCIKYQIECGQNVCCELVKPFTLLDSSELISVHTCIWGEKLITLNYN